MREKDIVVVELSGEHPNLPISEVLAILRGMGHVPREVWYEPRFLALRTEADLTDLVSRLAFGRHAGKALLWGGLEQVKRGLGALDLRGKRFRFRVAEGPDGPSANLEASLGGELTASGVVDLEDPEVDLRLVRGSRSYLYAVTARVDRSAFDVRAARNRPFARPVVLHPRFARALVNLTGVAAGETLLDPFCGTGGILMEAFLVGAYPVGADLGEEVIEGCRRNLAHFDMEADLHVSDVGRVAEEVDQADAIATDPPYGRGATTRGEDLTGLLERAFAALKELLDPGGRLAIALPAPEFIDLGRRHFGLLEWHKVRVHRSLDRYFCLFRRS
ncbi:MAG: methyltransferase domain-containing protein [Thermoplasmata archaeon]